MPKTKQWEHAVTPLDYDPGDRDYSPTCELSPPDTSGTWELVTVSGGYTFWKREIVSDTTEKEES